MNTAITIVAIICATLVIITGLVVFGTLRLYKLTKKKHDILIKKENENA